MPDEVVDARASMPRTVRVGGQGKRALLDGLRACKVQLNRTAEVLFEDRRFTVHGEIEIIEITCLSVAELGLTDGATYGVLVEQARRMGLIECPLELGPHLRMQFLEQPEAARTAKSHAAPPGSITVASPPLDQSEETPKGFYLRRAEGVLWLRGYWCSSDVIWKPRDVFVFRCATGGG
jgi:hypothetical protein